MINQLLGEPYFSHEVTVRWGSGNESYEFYDLSQALIEMVNFMGEGSLDWEISQFNYQGISVNQSNLKTWLIDNIEQIELEVLKDLCDIFIGGRTLGGVKELCGVLGIEPYLADRNVIRLFEASKMLNEPDFQLPHLIEMFND